MLAVGQRQQEKIATVFISTSALLVTVWVVILAGFILTAGVPFFLKYGLRETLCALNWYPEREEFGLLPMIIGTATVTAGALLLSIPVGVGSAIYLAEMATSRVAAVAKPLLELLAGIPSVVYGFWGMVVIVPLIRELTNSRGFSIAAAAVVLAVMILPTIISICIDTFHSVPREYREGSLALGATRWQTIRHVVLPAARSGIIAASALGLGRAIGETMAVLMVAGNVTTIPSSILDPVRTLTAGIALEMGYAAGDHARALFACGAVLFVMVMVINLTVGLWAGKKVK